MGRASASHLQHRSRVAGSQCRTSTWDCGLGHGPARVTSLSALADGVSRPHGPRAAVSLPLPESQQASLMPEGPREVLGGVCH